MTGSGTPTWRVVLALLLLAVAGLIGATTPALAANPPAVQTFYVPLPEEQLLSMLQTINTGSSGNSASPITSNVSISPIANGTLIYYDHWEDGYETDITNPTQTTTQIWGDGKIANGAAPGVTTDAGDVINAGGLIILKNDVATTSSAVTVTTPYQFNGRDKIASSKTIAVSRVSWAAGSLTNMAQSTVVYDTTNWGTDYRSPLGTDALNSYEMFEYSTFAIMAGKGGATINVDTNNDGTPEIVNKKLAEGESYVTPTTNYLTVGARVTSDKPVQVNLLTGDINNSAFKESRDAGLLPVSLWSNEYYTSVSTTSTYGTRVWLYNPGASPLTVTWSYRTSNGTGAIVSPLPTVSVPAGGVTSVPIPTGTGAKFSASAPFFAYSTTDSVSTGTGDGNSANSSYDWGYPLNPANTLTSQFLVGWAKGKNPNDTSSTENSAPVWATVTGNGETAVTVYVDLKADGLGANTDPQGNRYDRSYSLKELQQAKIYDNTTPAANQDQSGMLVYVLDPGVKLSGAWGEDPATAPLASPGLDAGTGMVPAPLFDVGKSPTIAVDADGDGRFSPGDTIEYEVRVNNTGRIPVSNLKLVDTLPTDTTYVANSTRYAVSGGSLQSIPDNAGNFPLAGSGYTFASDPIPVNGYIKVFFQVTIKSLASLTSGIQSIVNTVSASAGGYQYGSTSVKAILEAINHSYQGIRNLPVYGNASVGDTYPPGSTFTVVSPPATGTLSAMDPTKGTYTYTNATAGTYTFDYQICMPAPQTTNCVTATETIVIKDVTPVNLSGTVFDDWSQDKIQNGSEPGANAGNTLYVTAIDVLTGQTVATTPVAAAGTYTLQVVPSTTYSLVLSTSLSGTSPTLPAGWFRTGENQNGTPDSNANGQITVAVATSAVTGQNFGILSPPSVQIAKTADLAGDPDTQQIASGGTAQFKVTVTNTGKITLGDLILTDALAPGCAGAISGTLAPGASTSVTCTRTNVTADFINSATVTAQPKDINGANLGGTVTATDTTDVDVIAPAITIAKTATNSPVTSGGEAQFSIKVKNTGDVTLTNVSVSDPLASNCAKTSTDIPALASMAPNDELTYTCYQPNVTTAFTNVASVTGTPPTGSAVTSTGNAQVLVTAPAGLSIEKTSINSNDQSVDDQTVKKDSTVTFQIKVTNTGGTQLDNVAVTDTSAPNCDKTIGTLSAGASDTYTCTLAVTANLTNTAVAKAGTTLTASDVTNIKVIDPKISIRKLTNDADGKEIRVGTLVTWAYIVTNTGDVALTDVEVTDDPIRAITCPATELAVGASMTCLSYGPAVAGPYSNTGTVTADSPIGDDDVTASDDSSYTGVDPGVIGNRVWLDENSDGVQDAGEAGIPNLKVELKNSSNTVVATTYTDTDGGYLFTNVPAGDYTVVVTPTAGLYQTYDEDQSPVSLDNQSTLTLKAGELHLSADFGYNWAPASNVTGNTGTGAIGDRVWNDVNGNGRQDPGEAGIGGVTVKLLTDSNGDGIYGGTGDNAAVTTITDDAGNYVFDDLPVGAYVVAVDSTTLPVGQTWTQTGDPDGSGSTDNQTTTPILLAPGDVYVNADFGYQPSTGNTIGGTIFYDVNADTAQDAKEPGLPGVTVALRDSNGKIIATAITDLDGKYRFGGLPAGTYTVVVTDTDSVLHTGQLLFDPEHKANPAIPPDNETTVTFASLGGSVLDRDFGYTAINQHEFYGDEPGLLGAAGAIGDTIYIDRNGNSQPDPGEGVQGVRVELYDNSGALVAYTTTNADGLYSFGHVNVYATWTVKVVPSTLPNGGAGLTNSLDPDGGTPNQSTVSNISATGNADMAQDFGYTASGPATTASIGGTLWNDVDADGNLDPLPIQRLSGVTLALRDSQGNVVGATTTDDNGDYLFTNLPPGQYTVDVTDTANRLEGWWHSLGDQSAAVDNTSKADPFTLTVAAGEINTHVDFGYYRQAAALGNRTWIDDDNDGLQDAPATGVAGFKVTLLVTYPNGATSTVVTLTDATGAYRFGNLLLDESFQASTAGTPTTTEGKPSYHISAETPAGYVAGKVGKGDGKNDSDPHSGVTAAAITRAATNTAVNAANPSAEPDNAAYDFAYLPEGSLHSISGVVYNDADGDGDLSERGTGTETGLSGVTVTLYTDPNGDGDPSDGGQAGDPTTTGVDGAYSFADLPSGKYVVVETNPTGYVSTNDVSPPNNDRIPVTLVDADVTGQDFLDTLQANSQLGSIAGQVRLDQNGDGDMTTGDPGMANITVQLWLDKDGDGIPDVDGLYDTQRTNGDGNYSFTALPPGHYVVVEINLTNYVSTNDAVGVNDDRIPVNLQPKQAVTGRDFLDAASADLAPISGQVIDDLNSNGVKESGEPGINGVTVKLYSDPNGDGNPSDGVVFATTTTDGSGNYSFPAIPAGKYVVVETDPPGYSSTGDKVGANDNRIPVTRTGTTASAGNDFLDSQAGPPRASIGNRVWLDENGDGVQDAGEAGIPNLIVTLTGAGPDGQFGTGDDTTTATLTDLDGGYLFGNLPAGNYKVVVTPTAGLNSTYNEDTGTTTPDNATTFTLTTGAAHLTADFGYNWVSPGDSANPATGTTGAIGDRVWNDANGNGRQDPGEAGVVGVTVKLLTDSNRDGIYGGTGDTAAVTTTAAADGSYIFDGLAPGAYVVTVDPSTLPTGNGLAWSQKGDPDSPGGPCSVCDNQTTSPVILAPGDVYVNADFGYQPSQGSTIGDRIYLDANGNGADDGTDPGIPGVTVVLLNSSGMAVIATTTTDQDGRYAFPGLPAGTYIVAVTDTHHVLGDLVQTGDPDSLAAPDRRSTVTVNGTDNKNQDFGFAPPGHQEGYGLIGDTIFLDRNGNNGFDPSEGLAGMVVNLYDSTDTLIGSTVTNANGQYAFGGLSAGSYRVQVDTSTLPNGGTGLTNSVDPDGGTAHQATVTLSGGAVNLSQDFGYAASAPNTIGGTLWNDADADGTLAPTETGRLAGVTIELRDSTGRIVAVTTTDASGNYSFTGLPDGTYQVFVTDTANLLEGYWKTYGTPAGSDNHSQPDGYSVKVEGGQTNTTADFGYYRQAAALGNRTWIDTNNNGLQDSTETTGPAGVKITLLVTYPNGATSTVVTLTDATGAYRFGNLLLDESFQASTTADPAVAGPRYGISAETAPAGYVAGLTGKGNGKNDSDPHSGVTAAAITRAATNTAVNAADPSAEPDNAAYDFAYRSDQANVFDPPSGRKTVNAAGIPVLEWRMVWINNGNTVANRVRVVDPIPAGTTYVPNSLTCEPRGQSLTDNRPPPAPANTPYCYYDTDTNQVIWQGTIYPEANSTIVTEQAAQNEVVITFQSRFNPGVTDAQNTAQAYWDANGSNDVTDDIGRNQTPEETNNGQPVGPLPPSTGIPTLSEWSLGMLILLFGWLILWQGSRRRSSGLVA